MDEVDADIEEVEEVEDVPDENCNDLCESFGKKVASMPFDLFKSNTNPTSSSKTTESTQVKTARSAPLRMALVIEPGNVKETNSAPTTRGWVVPTDLTRISGSKINTGNQYLTKNA